MSIAAGPKILTEAIVLKRLQVGAETCLVEVPNPVDPSGPAMTMQDSTPIYAEAGDLIDVSEWANVDSYVRQGYIHMVTRDVEVVLNKAEQSRVPAADVKTPKGGRK
jgi:hypothetical protein